MRGVDEVEIEVWVRARFVGWLAVPVLHRTMDAWQKNRPTNHPDRHEQWSRRRRHHPR
jgi:hypothetical protein